MGFLSKDTLEDVERVRKQRENEIDAKRKAELAANPPGKYVVLRYLTGRMDSGFRIKRRIINARCANCLPI